MPNFIKTPTQMMYEQAHIPHYAGGSKIDVLGQFSNRVADAIRKYKNVTGKSPSPEEIKQLEDYVQTLSKPTPKAPETAARANVETPFAGHFVDPSGRPYRPMIDPMTKQLTTPEKAKGFNLRQHMPEGSTAEEQMLNNQMPSQFGTTSANMRARKGQYEKPHMNAFTEDDFMSMANTGRPSSRTWLKSYTPSTEELAARQHGAEDVGAMLPDEELGGLSGMRTTQGDIPQMTSASEPLATRAMSLEAPVSDRISDEIMYGGKHGALVDKVVRDFRARGVEPDHEDIVNAVTAEINPLRHNYTGINPIGMRPEATGGGRPSQEMLDWRDLARTSGLPETVVTKHPADWKSTHQRDYLLDTDPEARAGFARDWTMEELGDQRKRAVLKKADGGMMRDPRDLRAEMMVNGYANGGKISDRDLYDMFNEGTSYDDPIANTRLSMERQYVDPKGDSMSAYHASPRERIADLGQNFLEKVGIRRPIARRASQSVVGGPSSALPGGFGMLDAASIFSPAAAMAVAPMYAAETGHSLGQGNYGEAALNALGAVPAARAIRRGFNQ